MAQGQQALDAAEIEFEQEANQREQYSDEQGQKQFEASLAFGASYDEALSHGQFAMDEAEAHFDEVNEEKKVYADNAAEEAFEQALAMGLPYDVAVQQGQQALDAAELEFEEEANEKEEFADAVGQMAFEKALQRMPFEKAFFKGQAGQDIAEREYDRLKAEKRAEADYVAQQEFQIALNAGASHDQAMAAGQYALDMTEQAFNEQLMNGQLPYAMEQMAIAAQQETFEPAAVEEEEDEEEEEEDVDYALEEAAEAYEAMEKEAVRQRKEALLQKKEALRQRAAYEQARKAAEAYADEKDELEEKLRLVKMREAAERRERGRAEELAQMRRDVEFEAMKAEVEKAKLAARPTQAPVPEADMVTHNAEFKQLMQEYREKRNAVVVDDGSKRREVVLTPPEDVVELPEEEQEFVVDNGMKTDTVVVSAAHHHVDAVKDTNGKVHTFSPDTMHNKINVSSTGSWAKSAVMGLGGLVSTGALALFALRWKNKPAQDFSGTAPLIDNSAFADMPCDVEMPPVETWASSAVCRALNAAEPVFDPIKA